MVLSNTYIERRTLIANHSISDWKNYKILDRELGEGYSVVVNSPFDVTKAIIYLQSRIKKIFFEEAIFSSMAWSNALISLYGIKSGDSKLASETVDLVGLFGSEVKDVSNNKYFKEDSLIKQLFEPYLEEH